MSAAGFLQGWGSQMRSTGGVVSAAAQPEEADVADMDYVCGDYMVSADGKLKRKVRRMRRKAVEEEDDETRGTEVASTQDGMDGRPFSDDDGSVGHRGPQSQAVVSVPAVLRGLDKDHANALIIMPPLELWAPIQALRKAHDPAVKRWMPHINLVWPFATARHQKECAAVLTQRLKHFQPFELGFNGYGSFNNAKENVLYLDPTTPEGEQCRKPHALRSCALDAFPELAEERFHPHLTVGKFQGKKAQAEMKEVMAGWTPMRFTVKEVYIVSRPDAETPFSIQHVVPLGSAAH
eukprot:Rhum_TRINITY_DN9443_c0_g1::Rhum_TRINITY_DN9443_c0_g1_i1::g.33345::m.33345